MISIRFLLVLLLLPFSGFSLNSNRIPVDSAGHYALLDDKGNRITDWVKASAIDSYTLDKYYLLKRDKQWELCDIDLKPVLPFTFDKVYQNNDLIYGEKGKELVIFKETLESIKRIKDFESIRLGSGAGEYAIIIKTSKGYGVLRTDGEWIAEPRFDKAFFMGDVVYTRIEDRFGFCAFETLVEPEWAAIGAFNKDVVEVWDTLGHRSYFFKSGEKIPDSDSTLVYDRKYKSYKIYKNGKARLYDSKLEQLVTYSGTDIFQIKWNKSVWVADHKPLKEGAEYAIKKNGKMGVVNAKGQIIIKPQYEHVELLFDGRYQVMLNGKFGVIDSDNKVIVPIKYTFVDRLRDFGHMNYLLYDFDIKGVANSNGEIIIPVKYHEIERKSDGFITRYDEKYGFCTLNGEEILQPVFNKVINKNGGLEYFHNGGRCMVGKNGLLTPLNCNRISKSRNLIKYYVNDSIVYHNLEDDIILDTTVYQLPKSVIVREYKDESGIRIGATQAKEFTNQLTGKTGAINKKGDGYRVQAVFFNVFDDGTYHAVKQPTDDYIELDGVRMPVKEELYNLFPSMGTLSGKRFSMVCKKRYEGWHSNGFDPIMSGDKEWEHAYDNAYDSKSFPFALPRSGRYAVTMQGGSLNFAIGDSVMSFIDYYKNINSQYNFLINSVDLFDRLAENKTVRANDPVWDIYSFYPVSSIIKVGRFTFFKQVNSKEIIVRGKEGIGVMKDPKTVLVPLTASTIKHVNVYGTDFYIARYDAVDEFNQAEYCLIFDKNGQIISQKYDDIEVLTANAFKVYKDYNVSIIDSVGQILYGYSRR